MGIFSRGIVIKLSFVLLFLAFVAAGLYRDELPDIIANATLICFSCIGLK